MATDIGYCCFTDTNNVGDYALYKANQLLFPEFNLFPGNEHRKSEVNLFGGGTLYPYCIRYGWYPRRKINVAIGQGVAEPPHLGRFGLLTRLAMRFTAFKSLGVRGPRSQDVLAAHGIRSEITGDTALVHSTDLSVPSKNNQIGISLVGEPMDRRGSAHEIKSEVLKTCHRLAADGFHISFIPFCIKDRDFLAAMSLELASSATLVDFWSHPIDCNLDRFLLEIRKCDVMVAERLHAAVLSAAVGVPFLSLGYKMKCFDFVDSLRIESSVSPIVDSRDVNGDELYQIVSTLNSVTNEYGEMLNDRVNMLRRSLRASSDDIRAIVSRYI